MEWKEFIDSEMEKDYFISLSKFLAQESKKCEIFPPKEDIFNAFKYCPTDKIKCVLLGQDPYINPGEAHGLCFSVQKGIPIPPSLKNIFKELENDLGIKPPNHGCLTGLAEQGVLLLNSVLTVRRGASGSHKNKGWEIFTDSVIKHINTIDKPIVHLLWGAYAKSKRELISNKNHLILESGHPSPLSCKLFFNCKHFSKANEFLTAAGAESVNWGLQND